jgi:hypothetical protein
MRIEIDLSRTGLQFHGVIPLAFGRYDVVFVDILIKAAAEREHRFEPGWNSPAQELGDETNKK